jgi:hypothetical protein
MMSRKARRWANLPVRLRSHLRECRLPAAAGISGCQRLFLFDLIAGHYLLSSEVPACYRLAPQYKLCPSSIGHFSSCRALCQSFRRSILCRFFRLCPCWCGYTSSWACPTNHHHSYIFALRPTPPRHQSHRRRTTISIRVTLKWLGTLYACTPP